MKKYISLIIGSIFFILALYTFTLINPTSASYDVLNSLAMFGGATLLCIASAFFITYFRENFVANIVGVIPVRMSSSRFPGKPLAKINGKPMLQHIYESCTKCKSLDDVYIATPDKEIVEFCKSINAKYLLTSNKHQRATERVAEAVEQLEDIGDRYEYIVMIQGDEPMIIPEMIYDGLEPLIKDETQVTNLMGFIKSKKVAQDKNTIKVVTDRQSNALYMSRSQIPLGVQGNKQVCVIAFTHDALFNFIKLKPTALEKIESIDMLRLLENGIKVKMVEIGEQTHAVDVPADIKVVEKLMRNAKKG